MDNEDLSARSYGLADTGNSVRRMREVFYLILVRASVACPRPLKEIGIAMT